MSASELLEAPHDTEHDEHAHNPFMAHHFDDPEQQFDAGKLGIWLFLVTEVLFFSGMFCAYAMYRSLHPEVWTYSSRFLNATLGAFNTGVLLFSSLSMAWGVRCAQLRQRTGLVVCLAITLGCAAIFLGVKAIEYSHKWDLGLLPAGFYAVQSAAHEHHEGISKWLIYFSIVPALCLIGFAAWWGWALANGKKQTAEIAGPFMVTALCYFVGVFVGVLFESGEKGQPHGAAVAAVAHAEASHDAHAPSAAAAHLTAATETGSPPSAAAHVAATMPTAESIADADSDKPGRAGLFFSIYYCMTGVHALHIIGGMLVLGWLLVRATKDHFHGEYFGPVDYVGLYWHLVDLIWIYLFPLLYLIK